jgi:glycosyltransferase involved in cell wall biosynthesis
MKIGIDARLYGPRQGGIGRYIQQLIAELEKLNSEHNFVIFLRKNNWDEYSPKSPNFSKVLADIPWYGWKEQLILPKIFNKSKLDLLHIPHWNVPIFYNGAFVITLHDLLLFHFPTRRASTLGPLLYWFKQLSYKLVLKHAVKKARNIITVSEFSKQDINQVFKTALDKITGTYTAPFPNLQKDTDATTVLTKYSLAKPYVLYVGVAFPHKNLERLAEAWQMYSKRYGEQHDLVLVGNKNYFYEQLAETIKQKQYKNIKLLGFVPDAELPTIYKNADLFVFPSLYEGAGIPRLEAMAYNVPVISSNKTCMPEILKNAVYYFDPEKTVQIVEAIKIGLTDQKLRAKLRNEGQKVYSSYSWRLLAEQTLDIYNKCG